MAISVAVKLKIDLAANNAIASNNFDYVKYVLLMNNNRSQN
ncbi:hypothetical protein [Fortiea sp. LEGE XX443]|nr:hypothetical protein [Fortiea sp. LEGE XX443]